MTNGEDKSNIEHLAWLTKNRSKNQRDSLTLFKLIKSYPDMSGNHASIAHLMIGTTFSLWRAVFLSDFRGSEHRDGPKEISTSAEMFLETIIRDNAIGFPQDKNSREWTFGYYVGSAEYRLRQIHELDRAILPRFKVVVLPPKMSKDGAPKWLWEHCENSLCQAIQNLRKALIKARHSD